MATKPTNEPKWATQEQIDPVSGQTNKIEPPQSYEDGGWSRREIPPRQYWNWMLWKIGQWISWLAAGTSSATASTVMERDANGRTKVAAPSADGDAVNKGYVDDTSGDVAATPSSLQRRQSDGRGGKIEAPTEDKDPVNKKFIDDQKETQQLALDGDFSGSIKVKKEDNFVTIITVGDVSYGSGDVNASATSSGFIPSSFRPDATVTRNVINTGSNEIETVEVFSSGTLQLESRDWTGSSADRSGNIAFFIQYYSS